MVQTEQQYKFVYMAIKDYVESQQALLQVSAAVSHNISSIIVLHCVLQGEKSATNYGTMTYPTNSKSGGEPVYDNMPHV